jgi:hypothetical protein
MSALPLLSVFCLERGHFTTVVCEHAARKAVAVYTIRSTPEPTLTRERLGGHIGGDARQSGRLTAFQVERLVRSCAPYLGTPPGTMCSCRYRASRP